MEEIELKAVVPDPDACRARVESAGARLVFVGRLVDRRWDLPHRPLGARDEVLRTRTSEPAWGDPSGEGTRHVVDWKGPTRREGGYKRRTERSTPIGDADVLETALRSAGFVVTREVERDIVQYDLGGAMLRFEWYPRLDVLLEVEGPPAALEAAIVATGLPRAAFGTGRLLDFALDYERRTGMRAAYSARMLADPDSVADHDG